MRRIVLAITLPAVLAAAGCGAGNAEFMTEERLDRGLVVILPGIEGPSPMNRDIRRGLDRAGVHRAIPIYSWGRPVPGLGPLLNQTDFIGNRLEGVKLARMISEYQDQYPGRPVHLIGHSGGGGVAVFAAEALPDGRRVDGLILLSASISSAYKMTRALNRCEEGIVNFYNRQDFGLLGVGTSVVGNVDGTHGPSAGLIGFDPPGPNASDEQREACRKLYQVELTRAMAGGGDPHAAATHAGFVSRYVSPWVLARAWPASSTAVAAGE